MDYEENYEDELSRMRRRRQQRKQGTLQAKGSSRTRSEHSSGAVRHTAVPKASKNSHAKRGAGRKKKKSIFPLFLILLLIACGMLLFRRNTGEGYWTIAVFGVDSRDGNLEKGALSDVEMICSINRKTGEMRLVSVFRDSYLRIDPEGSYDKINEAYFLGGHEQAVDALRDNFDIPVDDYATFNWKAVVDAINVLGGVDIEITDKEFAYINSFITETVNSTGVGSVQLEHSGMNHLDGVQAVAYARLRLMDTDFNRTERQRKVLGQVVEKAKAADFNTLKTLVGAVFPQISTSIGVDDLLSVAKDAKRYYIGQTSGFPFSHTEMKIGKKSCVIPTTLESNVIQLHSFLYDMDQYTPSGTVSKISAHIAEVSGLDTPGKDTESGKNVGAQDNTGSSGSSVPSGTSAPTAAEASEPSPDPADDDAVINENQDDANPDDAEESNSDNSSENSESSQANSDLPEETIESLESEPEAAKNSQTPDGTSESSANGPDSNMPADSSGPSGRPSGSGQNSLTGPGSSSAEPSTSTTGPGASAESPSRSGTSLEAPGQSAERPSEAAGPGV